MNVASRELCRELYDLSEWDDKHIDYYYAAFLHVDGSLTYSNQPSHCHEAIRPESIPAYSLGYLLRQLPQERESSMGTEIELVLRVDDGKWLAEYTDGNFVVLEANLIGEADTPEDAACKLAIQLFKQGILTKELTPTPTR